jgi:ribonuclease-3
MDAPAGLTVAMNGKQEQLEERLGYRFAKAELLERALTHSSAIPELRAAHPADAAPSTIPQDNEQLEFLGDAVLDMLASEHLLAAFPDYSEGQLSKSRARIVNARALELAFEAVIAAIYLDSGLEEAREVLKRALFEWALEERGARIADSDRKSALQEFLQGRGQPPAEYRVVGESGPDHQKKFRIEVWVAGVCMASGEGSTKKEAEQRAARTALERLEVAAKD